MSLHTVSQLQRKIALYEKNVFNGLNTITSKMEDGIDCQKMGAEIQEVLFWHEKRLFAIHELQVLESHTID